MRIDEVEREYRLSFIHNPRHFYPNSFHIEKGQDRLLLVGRVKRHVRKGYRKVAVLKPKRGYRTS